MVYFPVGPPHAAWYGPFNHILNLLCGTITTQDDLEQAMLDSAFGATDPPPVVIKVLDVATPVVPEADSATRPEMLNRRDYLKHVLLKR